jgi:hypothetical protein
VRQKKHLLRNAQREAWEVVCNKYEIKKARYNQLCQELREKGVAGKDGRRKLTLKSGLKGGDSNRAE